MFMFTSANVDVATIIGNNLRYFFIRFPLFLIKEKKNEFLKIITYLVLP